MRRPQLVYPSVAVANFSWDWIYGRLGFSAAAEQAAHAYAQAGHLIELEPAAPMPAFPHRTCVGVLARRATRDRHIIRRDMGVAVHERLILLSFRDGGRNVVALPPMTTDVRYLATACPEGAQGRDDVAVVDPAQPYIELVAAADVVVAKPGYGIIADCAGTGTSLLWVPRQGFPEDLVLERWLQQQPWSTMVSRADLAGGLWLSALESLLCVERAEGVGAEGLKAACRILLDRLS